MNKEQQIEEIEQFIYDYVDSKQPKGVYLLGSRVNKLAKPFVHNKGLSEALYNAGYRKVPKGSFICSGSETNLDVEVCNNCGMKQADELFERDKEIERLEAENKRLSEKLGQILLSIDTVKEMNAMCNIDEQRKQAVKEFAEKVKKCSYCDNVFMDGKWHRYVFVDDIDKLFKEYEK